MPSNRTCKCDNAFEITELSEVNFEISAKSRFVKYTNY